MLRAGLLIVAVGLLLAAIVAALAGGPFPLVLWLGMLGALVAGGIVFERGRYKPAAPGHPGPGWVATGESFVDPASGEPVSVYYHPASGERRYVRR